MLTRRSPRPSLGLLLRRFLSLCALALALATALPLAVSAADGAAPADPADQLEQVRQDLDAGQKVLQNASKLADVDLQALGSKALGAQSQAQDISNKLGPDLVAMDAQIAQLGVPPPGSPEAPDVAARRAQLTKARAALDGQIKLAKLLSVEGEQLAVQVWSLRRSQFQARLGERTHSILARPFWTELRDDLPRDRQRLATLGRDLAEGAAHTGLWLWLAIGVALATVWAGGVWAWHRLMGWLISHAPVGRLRRSLRALMGVTAWTLGFGAVATAIHLGFGGNDDLPEATASLVGRFTGMLWFAGYVFGLTTTMLSAAKPTWRLPDIADRVATELRWFPLAIAIVLLAVSLSERLVVLVNASLSMTVAVNCLSALAMSLTLTLSLMRAERVWRRGLAGDAPPARPIWSIVLAAVNWLVLTVAVASLLTGYVAFGSFAVKQVVWGSVILGTVYLLTAFIDDLLMAWLAPGIGGAPSLAAEGASEAGNTEIAQLPAKTFQQIGVLASGILRLAVLLVGAMLLLMPFGEGPGDLLRQTGTWHPSLVIGQFNLEPLAVLQALLVLVVGLVIVRLLRGWLSNRYLPSTSLDPSMRVSATSLFGYAGVVVAIALAMSALGIGLERIAWVASALSVGIGFGLQAVVQNFVSGLILLAERPVKVGDWVSLGGVEGDIRRINVRATEIEMGDRSTVIVPNSEFITKVVRNVTLANPIGLVSLKLPVPISSDPVEVRDLLLAAFDANTQVLEAPAPSVLLDGIDNGALVFNASGFVDSPRSAYGVRSALLFDILQRLQAAGIPLAKPPTMVLREEPSAVAPTADTGAAAG